MRSLHLIILSLIMLASCSPKPRDAKQAHALPQIYPDYIGVTIPENIAPLNFYLKNDCEAVYAKASNGKLDLEANCHDNIAAFPLKQWQSLLQGAERLTVTVWAQHNGEWIEYDPFIINIVQDKIDPYLTYRLIEPDYEVFSRLQIEERCIENFDKRVICDYNLVGNRCMNCHTYNPQQPGQSFLYVRGEGGGMILCDGGQLRKLALKTDDMVSGSVYAQLSPNGRFMAFSANKIIPGFHSDPSKRLEVFDTKSDVYIADLVNNRIISNPTLADSTRLETFPAFSPDGRSLYYCVTNTPERILDIDSMQYSLCRVDFDQATGLTGTAIDTLVVSKYGTKTSTCHPRVSPDGRFLLYTVADYGTFPIWHRESDQQMLDLSTGQICNLEAANSNRSDTYHSWSSSGRWFVFASKRDDGLYGKPYFCYIDDDGMAHKPFVLPQKSPTHYDNFLKSYNAPELGRVRATFTARDIADAMQLPAESFR